MDRIGIIIILLILMSCGNKSTSNGDVISYGNRQLIIKENNLSATVRLDTTLSRKHNYAIGPVEGLQGEITIYDNEVSISTVVDGQPKVNDSKQTSAIFLLQTSQKDWQTIVIGKDLEGLGAIEEYVKGKLLENNLDINKAYPFRIEATVPSMVYHIIFKMDDKPHNKKEHQKAKQKFTLENEPIKIIGFWVDEHRVGKLTHPGKRTHLHFMTQDNRTSGHVDEILIPKRSILYISKTN